MGFLRWFRDIFHSPPVVRRHKVSAVVFLDLSLTLAVGRSVEKLGVNALCSYGLSGMLVCSIYRLFSL